MVYDMGRHVPFAPNAPEPLILLRSIQNLVYSFIVYIPTIVQGPFFDFSIFVKKQDQMVYDMGRNVHFAPNAPEPLILLRSIQHLVYSFIVYIPTIVQGPFFDFSIFVKKQDQMVYDMGRHVPFAPNAPEPLILLRSIQNLVYSFIVYIPTIVQGPFFDFSIFVKKQDQMVYDMGRNVHFAPNAPEPLILLRSIQHLVYSFIVYISTIVQGPFFNFFFSVKKQARMVYDMGRHV